jgi:hypothetical protein
MDRTSAGRILAIAGIAAVCAAAGGCRRAGVGDTVPSPPRELIEKSYQQGPAPARQPGSGRGGGGPAGPR